jgi:P2-related tail formation protein
MINLYDYKTENALPSEMKTAERKALSYAYDQQKKMFIERIERVKIWADLEKVPDDKLDTLAVENRVLFYNSDLEPSVKRKLILNSIYWYTKLGTRQAMEEMLNTFFDGEESKIIEWYEYGGEPYHFNIKTTASISDDDFSELRDMVDRVKNARSRLDSIETASRATLNPYIASQIFTRTKNPAITEGFRLQDVTKENVYYSSDCKTVAQRNQPIYD